MTRRCLAGRLSSVLLLLGGLCVPVFAQQPQRPSVIWVDRGDPALLDLVQGPGGTDHQPGTEFTFVKESISGTSPKFDVTDEHGATWKVKLGEEARGETAATRLLWAAGYVVDENYYRAQIHVAGLPRLARGQEFVTDDGVVASARLERAGQDSANWSWYDNPFVGTREFNGLRVMMALVNNWDLKAVNNGASSPAGGGGQYGITDLGASFGRTGNSLERSKGISKDYSETRFIRRITPTEVDFVLDSRPFFLSVFDVANYRLRTRMESIARHVPLADARWIGDRLGALSLEQIRDCFRTSGYPPADVEAYVRVVTERIAELKALDARSAGAAGSSSATQTDSDARRCLTSTCRNAPVRETISAIDLGAHYVRALVGGFEQGSGLNGGVQVTSADAIPTLELRAAVLASVRRYRRIDLELFLPAIGSSRNHADVWFSDLRRDLDFFGIGPRTSAGPETQYSIRRQSYQGSLYRDLAGRLQGGVYAQLMDTGTSGSARTNDTPIDQLFSPSPDQAVSRWIPGFRSDTRVLSYGGFLAYDARDNSFGLTRGVHAYGRVASADGLGRRASAIYRWLEAEADVRGYVPLGSHSTSLLLRTRAQVKAPRGTGSQIPFFDLSWLGGRQYLRGYESYRFRGNNMLLLSTEVQRTVRAITDVRGVDLFVFADGGQVWGDARSTTDPMILANQSFGSNNWHGGFGGGLQYRHSRSFAARLEVGRSRERAVVYGSLSRGF